MIGSGEPPLSADLKPRASSRISTPSLSVLTPETSTIGRAFTPVNDVLDLLVNTCSLDDNAGADRARHV